MKMELDKKLDTIRLNVLAANFGDLATRRQMIQEFGDYPDALWGVNENGEKVMVKDQIEIDFSQGREPLEYDPQLFYEVIREFIEQDAEDGE